MREHKDDDDLLAQFTDRYEKSDIHPEIWVVMEYIDRKTGLLGDYNDGYVHLAEPNVIQWWGRNRLFSGHNTLLHWIQEKSGVFIAVAGLRTHPETDEPSGYIEIHATDNWNVDLGV